MADSVKRPEKPIGVLEAFVIVKLANVDRRQISEFLFQFGSKGISSMQQAATPGIRGREGEAPEWQLFHAGTSNTRDETAGIYYAISYTRRKTDAKKTCNLPKHRV